MITDALTKTMYGNVTKADVQAVLFRKLMDTSTPEYYSVGAALKGIKNAVKDGAFGKIQVNSFRYTCANKTDKIPITEFAKQLKDVKNLRRFINAQGGTNLPVTVLRGENPGWGALYENIVINGATIKEIKQACAGMSEREFTTYCEFIETIWWYNFINIFRWYINEYECFYELS